MDLRIFILLMLVILPMVSPLPWYGCKFVCFDCAFSVPDGCRVCEMCRSLLRGRSS